ncbi:hypothetical protein K439DRAFT_1385900, partial [Ramaria rubella]
MLPPPTYAEHRTQLLISPSPDAVQFQKGFLGAQGERAAIEGELQIKGAEQDQWDSATICLQTIESNLQQSIEISSSTLILFARATSSSSSATSSVIPSTLSFSIPLPPDTPQCIHTSHSSISHHLVATLHPTDPTTQALTKSISVHTRRYTSPNRPLLFAVPHIIQRDDPISVKVEVPRTTFRIGEPIAIYITIPPPDIRIIRDRGLRLRNVMAELVRVISMGESPPVVGREETDSAGTSTAPSSTRSSSISHPYGEKLDSRHSSCDSQSNVSTSDGLHTILTRSGSSCRFHTSRPVQIRLLLYPHQSAMRHADEDTSLPNPEQIENDNSDCTSITQSTLLHTVSFYVAVNTTFMLSASHSEHVTRINVPIILLPNPAPLPEVDESVASAYRKKHDRPPARTIRHEDIDLVENGAGPSVLSPGGAPPPFEERDAPPPFFSSDPSTSTSSRLPTFLESESDFGGHVSGFSADDSSATSSCATTYISIPGEGTEFGFNPNDQYDGISSSLHRSTSPPPSMANATMDTDVTEFANLVAQPERALEALSLALDQPDPEGTPPRNHSGIPPPPPLLDDPSDPPPSIDVEGFRRPPVALLSREHSPPPVSLTPAPRPDLSSAQRSSSVNAPPPYLQPSAHSEPEGTVIRPPPYVDV